MSLLTYIGGQFHNPTGLGGRLAAFVMNRQNRRQYEGAEQALALDGAETVLDIGFGNGYLLNRLAGRHACRFYGIDTSPDMLRAATNRNRTHIRAGRMRLTLGGVEHTGLDSHSVDKAYTVNTVYFWSSLDAGLIEIRRVLKPGGVFVNVLYTKETLDSLPMTRKGYAKYALEELLEAGRRGGFTVEARPIAEGRSTCVVYRAR